MCSTCHSGQWAQRGRHVHLDAEGAPVRAGVPGDCDAQYAGRLHGQGAEVHRQGAHADREAQE